MPLKLPKLSLFLGLTLVSLGAVSLFGLSRGVDHLFYDSFLRMRGPQAAPDDIVIVALGEDFIGAYGVRVGELDRGFYARALDNLTQAGAKAIAVDFFFPEVTDRDDALVRAVAAGPVVLPHVVASPDGNRSKTLSDYSVSDHLRYNPKLETVPRGALRLEEYARYVSPTLTFRDGTLPSFSLAALQQAGLKPKRSPEGRLPIDYRGPAGSIAALSFLDVYRGNFAYSDVQDKIVLLGVTLTGTDRDQILTPLGEMPGIEVNANEVYTLLHGNLRTVPEPWYWLATLLLSFVWLRVGRRKRGLLYTGLAGLGTVLLSWGLFQVGLFASPFSPLVALSVIQLGVSYASLRTLDRELSSKLFGLFDNAHLGAPSMAPGDLAKGFTPAASQDGAELLESLLTGLNGLGGVVRLEQVVLKRGEFDGDLDALAALAEQRQKPQRAGTMPHYLAEPIFVDNAPAGVIALKLPAPLPPHLGALFSASVQTFSQLARHQTLRSRTETVAQTLLPFGERSSLDKLEALAVVSDLLATERGWLGALLETLPQAVFISGPYGYGIYKNGAARRLFGESNNLLRALPEVLAIDETQLQHDFIRVVEGGGTLELGLTERSSEKPVLLSLRTVSIGGEVRGVAGLVSDLGKIEELSRHREDMLALIVHDLRSPLTSIGGFSELLLGKDMPEDVQRYLEIINGEAGRMRRMTDEFMALSRLEAGEQTPRLSACNLAELLRHAVAGVSPQAAKKGIVVAVDAPPFVAAQLDTDLISRVLTNLLSNAVKYSPDATRVSVTLRADTQARLEVKDEGFGIPEAQLGKLFTKYGRVEGGAHAKVKGTGLGLYLVKHIVNAHGGDIGVTSQAGAGSTFRLSLPLRPAEPGSASPAAPETDAPRVSVQYRSPESELTA